MGSILFTLSEQDGGDLQDWDQSGSFLGLKTQPQEVCS